MANGLKLEVALPEDLPAWLALFHFWLDMKVRLYETDANGHMSQLTFFGYQEWASCEYWTHIGHPELMGSQAETSLFMGEQYCRFLAEVPYGKPLRLGVRCARIGRSSVTLEYAFCRFDERLAAIGLNTQVLVNTATHRPVPLPDDYRAAIQRQDQASFLT